MPDTPEVRELVEAIEDIARHRNDDLPIGPPSPLGGEVQPNMLRTQTEAKARRSATFGKAILEASGAERLAIRNGRR